MISINRSDLKHLNNLFPSLDVEGYFNFYGGKSLGLDILKNAVKIIKNIVSPEFFILKFDNNFDHLEKVYTQLIFDEGHHLNEKTFLLKISTNSDDFSNKSLRGKNSSIKNPRIQINKESFEMIKKFISEYNNENDPNDVKSILFQEYIEVKNPIAFICHYTDKNNILEVYFDKNTYIIVFDKNGLIKYSESTLKDRSINTLLAKLHIQTVLVTLSKLFELLRFKSNLEGIINYEKIIVLQLRTIPNDDINNQDIGKKIKIIKKRKYPNMMYTKFVVGDFDIVGIAVLLSKAEEVLNNLIVVDDETENEVWENPFVKNRLIDLRYCNFTTLIISFDKGFHLSHAEKCLPPIKYRGKFKNVCLPWLEPNLIQGHKLRLLSSGQECVLYFVD